MVEHLYTFDTIIPMGTVLSARPCQPQDVNRRRCTNRHLV